MYFWDAIEECNIGKKYRNSWNGIVYESAKTETGIALVECGGLFKSESNCKVVSIELID